MVLVFAVTVSVRDVEAQTSSSGGSMESYVNSNYGFSIQYPQGWQVQENPTNAKAIVLFSDLQGGNLFDIDKKQYDTSQHSLKEFADTAFSAVQQALPSSTLINEGSLTVGGQDSYFIEYNSSSSNSTLVTKIVLVKADTTDVYAITFVTTNSDYQGPVQQFDNVVSTFAITASTGTETTQNTSSSLAEYISKQYSFSISYPQGWQVQENPTNPKAIVMFSDSQGNNAITIDEKQSDLSQSSLKTMADYAVGIIQNVMPGTSLLEESSLSINGKDAYFVEYKLAGNTPTINKIFLVAADSKNVFIITCVTADVPYEARLNQFDDIASSFTLIGSASQGTASQATSSGSQQANSQPSMPPTSKAQIPIWVRTTAKWWAEGQVGDSDFTKGIQYLIQQGIMQIPPTSSATSQSQQIPAWIKTNAKWWAQGQISDDDFVKGIQYLVSNGIINMNPGNQQNQGQQSQQQTPQQPQQQTQSQSTQSTPTPSAGGWQVLQESICYQKGGCNVGTNAYDTLNINADGSWSFGSSSGKWSVSQTTGDDANKWGYGLADPSQATTKFPYKITLDGWDGGSASGPLELSSDGKVNFIWVIYPYDQSNIGPALIVMKFYLPSQTG